MVVIGYLLASLPYAPFLFCYLLTRAPPTTSQQPTRRHRQHAALQSRYNPTAPRYNWLVPGRHKCTRLNGSFVLAHRIICPFFHLHRRFRYSSIHHCYSRRGDFVSLTLFLVLIPSFLLYYPLPLSSDRTPHYPFFL